MRNLSRRAFLATALPALMAARAFAQEPEFTNSISSISPQLAVHGKLATRTEIITDRTEAPMISQGSLEAMQQVIERYEEIVSGGGWPKVKPGKYIPGRKSEKFITLRQRLIREGYLDFETLSSGSPEMFDEELISALRVFQLSRGIATSGKMDDRTLAELNISAEARLFSLKENVPRIQTHLEGLGPRQILVNIPAVQLETVENGVVYSRHNIIVGKRERPSPSLSSTVTDVSFNPYWNAPASIVARDIVPKYLKDPNYLDQMRIRIFDNENGGIEIDPTTVDWESTPPERYHFRQEPGEHNAMATVKVNFKNKFMVYMHDTPHREIFQTNARFESSGCVRVDQVRAFITWILQGQEEFSEAEFEMIAASEEPHVKKVVNAPDVRFMYLTAWATEDGRVNFRPDIYDLGGKGFITGQPDAWVPPEELVKL